MFKTILTRAMFSHFGLVQSTIPICSMYGIFTYIYHKFMVNVRENSIHGAFGILSKIVVDPKIPSSKNPSRSCWLHPFAMVLALCERSTSFLGKRSVFFVLPKSFGESFSPKDGLDHLVWFRVGVGVTTPFPWFPRFTPLTPFFWFGWLGWILGRGFVGGWCEIQPRHCGFPWYMSGENVWKIDNWNGNFDSLTSCVPYSAGAPSNVVGFFNGTH